MILQVLIVESDPHTRNSFVESIAQSTELELAAAIESVAEAKLFLNQNYTIIDVLVINFDLPDGNGIELICHAKSLNPAFETLVITMHGEEEKVLACMEAGALGYIHKDESPKNIERSILSVRAGAFPMSPIIGRMVLDRFIAAQQNLHALLDTRTERSLVVQNYMCDRPLSSREIEVLNLLSRGYSYRDIGRMCDLSVATVQTHVKSLYRKLEVNSKTEAVFEAIRMGLIPK